MATERPGPRWREASPWEGVRRAAARFDGTPFSPAGTAEFLLNRLRARQNARAASDLRWAELEARRLRATGADGWVTITDDFGHPEMEELDTIARSITPDPLWAAPAGWVAEAAQTWRLTGRLERWHQKALFGWDQRDILEADAHLCRMVGRLLIAYDQLGWTRDPRAYPSEDAWHDELVGQAAALLAYAAAIADPDVWERPDSGHARRALHWVADHLHQLGD